MKTNTEQVVKRKDTSLASLPVYVRLIRQYIRDGDEAAKEAAIAASIPHYIEAGAKLLEVKKAKLVKGNFKSWARKTFQRGDTQIHLWMRLAKKSAGDRTFRMPRTLEDFSRPDRLRTTVDIKKKIVDDIKRAHPEFTERFKEKQQQREAEEAEKERLELKVALELISIGYRALATKLHPDRNNGGSQDAMQTLNMIRDSLKRFANKEWGY